MVIVCLKVFHCYDTFFNYELVFASSSDNGESAGTVLADGLSNVSGIITGELGPRSPLTAYQERHI